MDKKLLDIFADEFATLDTDEKIHISNSYVYDSDCDYNPIIHENNEIFIEENFSSMWDLLLSAEGTGYRTHHKYAWIDDLGNLYSTDFESELPLAEVKEMAEFYECHISYLATKMSEFANAVRFGVDEDGEDEEEYED